MSEESTNLLLRLEWAGHMPWQSPYAGIGCCPACGSRGVLYATDWNEKSRHRTGCELDEALRREGFWSAESRDQARASRGLKEFWLRAGDVPDAILHRMQLVESGQSAMGERLSSLEKTRPLSCGRDTPCDRLRSVQETLSKIAFDVGAVRR